jgi:hypothetical protein
MIRNTAGQKIGAQIVDSNTGAAFTGAATVYVTGDGGVQAIGETGGGVCTDEGNGYYTYAPSQAETNYNLIAFSFSGAFAVPITIQVQTITLEQLAALQAASNPNGITVIDVITAALQDLEYLDASESPTADDARVGLSRLNDWIDDLKNDSLFVHTIRRTEWTLTSAASYTIGDGADIDVQRPISPTDINCIGYFDTSLSTPYQDFPVSLFTDNWYETIPQKALTSTYPQGFYYDATFGNSGFGAIIPWPVPTSVSLQGFIYTKIVADEFTSLYSTIMLPPGYRRFFRSNLSIELASAFGLPVPPQVARAAQQGGMKIKRKNVRAADMSLPYDGGRYDINSDMIIIRR